MATNAEIEYCYHSLAIAIVKQAVKDYRDACRGIGYDSKPPQYVKKEVRKFLLSDWFEELTNVSGKYIYRILKDEEKKGELYEGQLNTFYAQTH